MMHDACPTEDRALADAIALEGIGSGTLEHIGPLMSLFKQKVEWAIRKQKSTGESDSR
jgi:hypothetical protein